MKTNSKKNVSAAQAAEVSATVFEAKTHLSRLLAQVKRGAVVTITSGRQKTPVARLTAVPEALQPRRLGALAHLNIHIPPEFFAPLTDEEMGEFFGDAFE